MPRTTTTVSGMLTTQNQGGGNKKAGLVPTETASVAQANAYRVSGYPKSVHFMMRDLLRRHEPHVLSILLRINLSRLNLSTIR